MNNRAKCKLCNAIIESFHSTDYVICNCGEISVDGGPALKCAAKNWENFIRVDDNGNEIDVTVLDEKQVQKDDSPLKTKKEKIDLLKRMIESYEALPPQAMFEPASNGDLLQVMMIVYSIVKGK